MQGLTDIDDQPLVALPPRERILKTASELFYRFSVHTIGVDRIIAESGVAKMTFYKHFPSKAQLIAEYLRQKTLLWMGMLSAATEGPDLSPTGKVLAIFDALDISFRQPQFRGCPFVKGLAEFGPEAESPEIKATIAAYFDSLHDLVAGVLAPLTLADHEKPALQILSLIQGSIVMAQTLPGHAIAATNRDLVEVILTQSLRTLGPRSGHRASPTLE